MYLLDASTFTEAEKRWYNLDFCPAYWDWVEEMNSQREVYSVEKVREKLFAAHEADPFFHWAARGASPNRTRSPQNPVLHNPGETTRTEKPHRKNPQLETHPQRPDHPLSRPARHQPINQITHTQNGKTLWGYGVYDDHILVVVKEVSGAAVGPANRYGRSGATA